MVSIITPMYNCEKYISSCLNSVLNQSYKKWELLVVDDCSKDNSVSIVQDYADKDPRIQLIRHDKNRGPAEARNTGLAEASGTYIAFLDSDDQWLPDKLEKQVFFMESNELLVTYSSYYIMDEEDQIYKQYIAPAEITYKKLAYSNFIGNLTGIYNCEVLKKRKFKTIGHEDYAMWLGIMKDVGRTRGLTEPLARYRITKTGISSKKHRNVIWQWRIYRTEIGLSCFSALFYLIGYLFYGLTKYRKIKIKSL